MCNVSHLIKHEMSLVETLFFIYHLTLYGIRFHMA